MKVGIITLHRVFNYGSVLQAYATQQIFKSLGHNPVIIDYVTEQRTFKRLLLSSPNNIKNPLHRVAYTFLKLFSILVKKIIFGSFLRRHVTLTKEKYVSFKDLQRTPPVADIYITGSDQVWNSKYNEGVDKGFYLEFAPEDKKRIAYASSFGKDILDEDEIDENKELLGKYSSISVREDTAVNILRDLSIDSISVIDPTLQLTKEDWCKISKKRVVKENYLLLMLLYNEDNGGLEHAKKIAKQKNLKIVKISWELMKSKSIDILRSHKTPEEFLSLFKYADYVVTNSFHGLVFSLIFNKQFIMIPRNEFNTRIESLLRLTNLGDRLVKGNLDMNIVDKLIDYDDVDSVIEAERKKTIRFLENSLSHQYQER